MGSSICVGIALLSRVTFGIPGLLQQGAALFFERKNRIRIGVPVGIALAVLALMNYLRFHSPFVFQDMRYYTGIVDHVNSPSVTQGNFNLHRVPDTLSAYFGLNREAFSGSFPFVRLVLPELSFREWFSYWEPSLSLWVGSGWALILGVSGAWMYFRRRQGWIEHAFFLGLGFQAVLILNFLSISERYLVDLIPLGVFLVMKTFEGGRLLARRGFKIAVLGIMILNASATLLSTYAWTGEYWWATPSERREEVRDFIRSF
jgi:hypothetical protein